MSIWGERPQKTRWCAQMARASPTIRLERQKPFNGATASVAVGMRSSLSCWCTGTRLNLPLKRLGVQKEKQRSRVTVFRRFLSSCYSSSERERPALPRLWSSGTKSRNGDKRACHSPDVSVDRVRPVEPKCRNKGAPLSQRCSVS